MWTGKDWVILLHLPTPEITSTEACAPIWNPICLDEREKDREVDFNLLPIFRQRLNDSALLWTTGRTCSAAWAAVLTESQNQSGWKRPLGSRSPTYDWTPPSQLDHGIQCHIQCFSVTKLFLMSNLNLPKYRLGLCPLILSLIARKKRPTPRYL